MGQIIFLNFFSLRLANLKFGFKSQMLSNKKTKQNYITPLKYYARLNKCTIAVKELSNKLEKKSYFLRLCFRGCTINFLEPAIFRAAAASGVISNGNQKLEI